MGKDLLKDFKLCKRLTKKCSSSYYYSTLLFPKKIRMFTFALYAFFRVFDEIVDNPAGSQSKEDTHLALRHQVNEFYKDLDKGYSDRQYFRSIVYTINKHGIPRKYIEAFFTAMMSDLFVKEYNTYKDLQDYMYGSANVVGIMMCYLFGKSDEDTLYFAEKLGEAFQFTNFLRDIDEDFNKRGRIYLPLDDIYRFGITREQFEEGFDRQKFIRLWEFEKTRNLDTYKEASRGIKRLSIKTKLPVILATILYKRYLKKPKVRFAKESK